MKACPILLLFALLVTVATAKAVESTITWDAPTHYVNGDEIQPDGLSGYLLYVDGAFVGVTNGLSFVVDVQPGLRCFGVKALASNLLYSDIAEVCQDMPSNSPPNQPVFVCP